MHRDARQQLKAFLDFTQHQTVLPVTNQSATISASWYAKLRQRGKPLDDMDLLIAGVALANELILVTHNGNHFQRITDLETVDWSQSD